MEVAPRARWLVLGNAVAMNFLATGMAWTYIVVLVAPLIEDRRAKLTGVVDGAEGDRGGAKDDCRRYRRARAVPAAGQ